MKELDHKEIETVSGGIFINPWTVMIGLRAIQIGAPYAKLAIATAATAIAQHIGYRHGEED